MQRTILVLGLAITSFLAYAAGPELPVRTLSLEQCVQMALERNLDVQIRR
jgi:hypothetical protein